MEKNIINMICEKTMEMDMNVDKRGIWDWGAGVALYGLVKVYRQTGEDLLLQYIKKFIDRSLQQEAVPKSINTTAPLLSALLLYQVTNDKKYANVCNAFADWLMNEAPRTDAGGLEHGGIGIEWHGELWVDTIFMAGIFLAEAGKIFKNTGYTAEAWKQLHIHLKYLAALNGLFYHGYSQTEQNHKSAVLWGRGNSWVTVSIPEICEQTGEIDEEAVKAFRRQAKELVQLQDSSGLWHTVLDEKASYCETSASAGFVCGLLHGIRLGYLPKEYLSAALRGYEAVLNMVSPDGIVQGVSRGTGIRDTKESYMCVPTDEIMPWGQGLTLMMLVEMECWREQEGELKCWS